MVRYARPVVATSLLLPAAAFFLLRGPAAPDARAVRACEPAPAPLTVADPERNLVDIETISNNLKETTMNVVCSAIRKRQFADVRTAFVPDARVQQLLPRVESEVYSGPAGRGTLVRPADPACHGTPDQFVEQLAEMTKDWEQVDRCFFKAFRIFATKGERRRARVDLHLWLGGTTATGGRIGEKGDVEAELEEVEGGTWRFTRLTFGVRERFQTDRLAFVDRTAAAGLPTAWTDEGYTPGDIFFGQILYGGVSVGDADGDGHDDLYISRAGQNLLLKNDGKGRFSDVTSASGTGDPGNSQSALFVDFDNDGDRDLFVVNAYYSIVTSPHTRRGHRLYRNDGNGRFLETPARFDPVGPASGASAADYDGDGLVDIYVTYYQDEKLHPYHHFIETKDGFGNRLFRNRGGLTFEDVTAAAGVGGQGWTYASAWADYDDDGRIDLYVANDFGDNYLFRNRGDKTFEDVAARVGVSDPANGMSADWGDYNNDGRLDMYVSNMYSKTGNQFLPLYPDLDETVRRKLLFSVQGNSLYENGPGGSFREVGRTLGVSLAGWAWGSNFLDVDNDGWLDLHVANGFWTGQIESDA